jgi:hypothetical protein
MDYIPPASDSRGLSCRQLAHARIGFAQNHERQARECELSGSVYEAMNAYGSAIGNLRNAMAVLPREVKRVIKAHMDRLEAKQMRLNRRIMFENRTH